MNETSNRYLAGATEQSCDRVTAKAQVLGAAGMGECARQSAKGVIRDRANWLRNQAASLEALARALPEELPPQADQALWDLIIAARR